MAELKVAILLKRGRNRSGLNFGGNKWDGKLNYFISIFL